MTTTTEKAIEALRKLIAQFDSEVHDVYDGTHLLDSRLAQADHAREALAAIEAERAAPAPASEPLTPEGDINA